MSEQRDIICRCEEVTRAEIMEAIKRRTRAGMGFCQGRTCKRLIAQILSAYYHMPVDRFLPGSIRMPITPISLRLLADTVDGTFDPEEGGEAHAPHPDRL